MHLKTILLMIFLSFVLVLPSISSRYLHRTLVLHVVSDAGYGLSGRTFCACDIRVYDGTSAVFSICTSLNPPVVYLLGTSTSWESSR